MASFTRALVTGASAGIGEEFCRQLAARGCDLVVVARREDRLRDLEASLHVDVEVVVADLAISADVERLTGHLGGVDLLVNNAGIGTSGNFATVALDDVLRELHVNVEALMRLTHAALPEMVEQGRGSLIHVSSIAGNQPGPGAAVYGATKAFVTSFSEALSVELRGTGVTSTAVLPGFTRTEFHEANGVRETIEDVPEVLWTSAEKVVSDALGAAENGRPICVPGWPYKIFNALSTTTGRAPRRKIMDLIRTDR